MTAPFTRTSEGFLTGRAIVTSIGVFTYRNADGGVSRELRLPEAVFDSESLASMKLKPVTNNHPTEKVTPANTQALAVGSLGSNPSSTVQERTYDGWTPMDKMTDGFHVAIDMTINQAEAIEDVLNGKRALSMGYECEIEKADEGATWLGMAYDSIQRRIRYNHCAIVDKARAGDVAQIHLDSADAVLEIILKEGEMKSIRIDGVDYQGDEGLILNYNSERKRADTAEKALEQERTDRKTAYSKLEAERDTAKDRADKAEAEAKQAKADAALSPERLNAAVKEKLALYDAVDRAGVEIKDDMADTDIKRAVITAVFPVAKLDGKDEAYLSARFDSAVEVLANRADGESRSITGDLPSGETRNDSATARKRMVELNRRLSRGEKEA
jgi:hypothetical protein